MIRIPIQLSFPWWQRAGEGLVCGSSPAVVPRWRGDGGDSAAAEASGAFRAGRGCCSPPAGVLGGWAAAGHLLPMHLKYKAARSLRQAATGKDGTGAWSLCWQPSRRCRAASQQCLGNQLGRARARNLLRAPAVPRGPAAPVKPVCSQARHGGRKDVRGAGWWAASAQGNGHKLGLQGEHGRSWWHGSRQAPAALAKAVQVTTPLSAQPKSPGVLPSAARRPHAGGGSGAACASARSSPGPALCRAARVRPERLDEGTRRRPRRRGWGRGRCCRGGFGCGVRGRDALTAVPGCRVPAAPPPPCSPCPRKTLLSQQIPKTNLSSKFPWRPPSVCWQIPRCAREQALERALSLAWLLPPAAAAGKKGWSLSRVLLGDKSQNLYQSLFDHLSVTDI